MCGKWQGVSYIINEFLTSDLKNINFLYTYFRDLPRLLEQATNESQTAINVMLSVDETYADIMPVRFDEKTKTAFV